MKIDEIRIPRSTGRLLRIKPHDRLLILDTVYYVVSSEERKPSTNDLSIELMYHLNQDLDYISEHTSLTNRSVILVVPIEISSRLAPIAYFVLNDRTMELEDSDIQILANGRSDIALRPEPYSDDR